MEPAARVVGLGLIEEAIGVGDMAGVATEVAQGGDRMPAGEIEHLVLVEALALVAELVAEVAEQGGGLVTDLARAQSIGHLGQRLELLTNTEPVSGGGHRDAARA